MPPFLLAVEGFGPAVGSVAFAFVNLANDLVGKSFHLLLHLVVTFLAYSEVWQVHIRHNGQAMMLAMRTNLESNHPPEICGLSLEFVRFVVLAAVAVNDGCRNFRLASPESALVLALAGNDTRGVLSLLIRQVVERQGRHFVTEHFTSPWVSGQPSWYGRIKPQTVPACHVREPVCASASQRRLLADKVDVSTVMSEWPVG